MTAAQAAKHHVVKMDLSDDKRGKANHAINPTLRAISYMREQWLDRNSTFTNEEYADIHLIYGFCECNSRAAVKEYKRRFPNRKLPSRSIFSRVHQRLRETGSFHKKSKKKAINQKPDGQQEDGEVEDGPKVNDNQHSQENDATSLEIQQIIHRGSQYPYHFRHVQALQPEDYAARTDFCQWLVKNSYLVKKLLFTDEAQFTLEGITNCHNSYVWSYNNPYPTFENNYQHRYSVNVWCGLLNNQLIGPYITEGQLTGNYYLYFLQNELPLLLEDVPVKFRAKMWLQQEGTPYFYGQVTEYLNYTFGKRWIGYGAPQAWPPRSPDLTPLDFFLWGHMKEIVYQEKSATIDELVMRIRNAAAQIQNNPDTIKKATRATIQRAKLCLTNAGGHFE